MEASRPQADQLTYLQSNLEALPDYRLREGFEVPGLRGLGPPKASLPGRRSRPSSLRHPPGRDRIPLPWCRPTAPGLRQQLAACSPGADLQSCAPGEGGRPLAGLLAAQSSRRLAHQPRYRRGGRCNVPPAPAPPRPFRPGGPKLELTGCHPSGPPDSAASVPDGRLTVLPRRQ